MTIAFKILRPVALFTLSVLTLTPKAHAAGVVGTCDESSLNAAVAGGGIVTFTCSGTISLSKNILIQLPTTIDATGQNVTLNGTDSGDILFIQDLTAVGFNVDLVNLTFLKSALSAVYLTSNIVLHVDNCIFSGNDSGSRHYGGAIYVESGTVYVRNSSFFGNKADALGGAIYNGGHGSLSVSNSTFFINGTRNPGSAGGGIMDDNGILLVINSTFNGNYAFQGLGGNIYSLGPSLIRNATLTGGSAPEQGGNIWAPPAQTPSTTLINTIVANPTVGGNCFGNIADGGGNLHYPSSYPCVGAVGDPRLGPLGNNYGPTQTMPLLAGSAAIDAVVNPFSCPETDQRGVLRAQGRRCDIGAYEVIPNITGVVGQLESSLMNFKSNLPRTGADKLTQQLIAPLLHSLDAMFWQADGNHINPQLGEQVFDLHQTVVNKLSELIDNEIEWTYIHNLLLADRTLAIAAMSAANCDAAGVAAPTNAKCAQAASQVALGDGSAAAGNYGEAIDHYKSAWGNATSPSTHE